MALYSGRHGGLYLLAPNLSGGRPTTPTTPALTNLVGGIQNWRFSIAVVDHDATDAGDQWDHSESGLKSWSGSFEMRTLPGAANNQDELDAILLAGISGNTLASSGLIQACFFVDRIANAGRRIAYAGAIRIQTAEYAMALRETTGTTTTFMGVGPLHEFLTV